jgi:hypothetical protein
VNALLAAHPASTEALARFLGVAPVWAAPNETAGDRNPGAGSDAALSSAEGAVKDLLRRHPQATTSLARLLDAPASKNPRNV